MSESSGPPPKVDARYAAALKKQKAERKQMTQRRRPILRLVWDADNQDQADEIPVGQADSHPE